MTFATKPEKDPDVGYRFMLDETKMFCPDFKEVCGASNLHYPCLKEHHIYKEIWCWQHYVLGMLKLETRIKGNMDGQKYHTLLQENMFQSGIHL